MRNLSVHWYEGLFIRPQHLQAADRHWAEVLHTSESWIHAPGYGLYSIDFSTTALANHQFEVRKLQAKMRDGTVVNLEAGQEPDRLDLRQPIEMVGVALADLSEAFDKESVVRVYLAIPKVKMGSPNVGNPDGNGAVRYLETELPVQDESCGGNEEEIQFRQLSVRLVLSTQDTTGYDLLPIAQIKRASEGEATPQLDSTYIPPVLAIQSWPELGKDIVRAIFDIIGQKVEVLSQQVSNRGIGLESREPGDAERIMMLTELNSAYGRLSVLAFAQNVHPFLAYTELCGILGQLSIFGSERRVTDIPPYDHDDLYRIFTDIRLRIEALINAVRDYEYEQRYFVGVGLGMQVSLEPKWFNSNWQWFIGVHKGELSQTECRDLLSPGQLDWKFGSSRQVEFLFKHRAAGLQLMPVDRAIRALPVRPDWLYYEVPRQDGPAWRDVQETQTLAMRLKDSLIVNLDRLQGERQIVVSAMGRKVTLQFALFAVPEQI